MSTLLIARAWCVAFAVLVSITAEAEQEPVEFASVFAPARMIGASGGLDRAIRTGRLPRAVDEDGAPLPIVQASYTVGDPDELAGRSEEIEPNGALKRAGERFPVVDRGAKGDPLTSVPGAKRLNGRRTQTEPYAFKSWPSEVDDPRDDEFDPGHTMSPQHPAENDLSRRPQRSVFDDGATPEAPLEAALISFRRRRATVS